MSNRQYVGARYVPKIMGEWNKSLSYEALSVVTYLGNSFTSKKPVPPNIDISNTDYWVNTGNYNTQLELLNNIVQHKKYSFDCVNTMKKANLEVGDIVETTRYYDDFADGGATYIISDTSSDISILLDNNLFANIVIFEGKITPTMIGCKGDGVYDDTILLQKAISYCENNGVSLEAHEKNTFLISSPLLITKSNLIINFNNASIINKSEDYALYINKNATSYMDASDVYGIVINDMIIKSDNYGIDVACDESRLNNIRIYGVSKIGINERYGGGTVFENCYIEGSSTSKESIGIVVGSSDDIFNCINGLNCYTFIKVNSPCELTKLHSWIGSKELYSGSTFIEINCINGTILRNSNVDTYSIVFKFTEKSIPTINMNNSVVIYNSSFISDTDNSYFYYQTNKSITYERGFEQIDSCIVQKPDKGNYYISNTTSNNNVFAINTSNSIFPCKSHDENNIAEFNNNNTFDGEMYINYGKYIRIVGKVTITNTDKNILYIEMINGYLNFNNTYINGICVSSNAVTPLPLFFAKSGDNSLYIQRYDFQSLNVGDVYYIDTTISWSLEKRA